MVATWDFLYYFCLLMYMFEIVHNKRVFLSMLLKPQQWSNLIFLSSSHILPSNFLQNLTISHCLHPLLLSWSNSTISHLDNCKHQRSPCFNLCLPLIPYCFPFENKSKSSSQKPAVALHLTQSSWSSPQGPTLSVPPPPFSGFIS